MAVKVVISHRQSPEDILAGYGAGALSALERSDDGEDGTYTEIVTVAVVAGTWQHEYWDPSGSTDSWYRFRYSNTSRTLQSDYTDPFSPEAPAAYASVDDVLLAMRQPTTDTKYLSRVEEALASTTARLIQILHLSYFRQPASGSGEWILPGNGRRRLHLHGQGLVNGFAAIDTIEVRWSAAAAWVTLDAADWYAEGEVGAAYPLPGEPYFHVVLTATAPYATWPADEQGVRITGAANWPRIPDDARAAVVAWTRQQLNADPALAGSPLGPDELGSPTTADRWPRQVYDLVNVESARHQACHT